MEHRISWKFFHIVTHSAQKALVYICKCPRQQHSQSQDREKLSRGQKVYRQFLNLIGTSTTVSLWSLASLRLLNPPTYGRAPNYFFIRFFPAMKKGTFKAVFIIKW